MAGALLPPAPLHLSGPLTNLILAQALCVSPPLSTTVFLPILCHQWSMAISPRANSLKRKPRCLWMSLMDGGVNEAPSLKSPCSSLAKCDGEDTVSPGLGLACKCFRYDPRALVGKQFSSEFLGFTQPQLHSNVVRHRAGLACLEGRPESLSRFWVTFPQIADDQRWQRRRERMATVLTHSLGFPSCPKPQPQPGQCVLQNGTTTYTLLATKLHPETSPGGNKSGHSWWQSDSPRPAPAFLGRGHWPSAVRGRMGGGGRPPGGRPPTQGEDLGRALTSPTHDPPPSRCPDVTGARSDTAWARRPLGTAARAGRSRSRPGVAVWPSRPLAPGTRLAVSPPRRRPRRPCPHRPYHPPGRPRRPPRSRPPRWNRSPGSPCSRGRTGFPWKGK